MTTLPSMEQTPVPIDHVLARARSDRGFRAALLSDSRTALDAIGINLPHRMELRVLDGRPQTSYLVLSSPPREGEVSDADLSAASGGATPVAAYVTLGVLASAVVGAFGWGAVDGVRSKISKSQET